MALEDLANVWILLQERIDIGHIIPEIIGHFSLSSVGKLPPAAQHFSFFVWAKVIFDLQRTYSQSSNPSPATQAYLIQPRILLATIHYVLDLKLQLYPHQRRVDKHTLAQRYFVARVLQSGLRALQLRRKPNDKLSIEEIEVFKDISALHELIQSWKSEAVENPDEQFILRKCETAILQVSEGPGSNSVWHRPACGSCELRDNKNSLWHALTPRIETTFVEQLEQLQANNEPSFWALFDILWAAEVGYIQWFTDQHSGKEVSKYESELHKLRREIRDPLSEPSALTVLLHGWSQDLKSPDPLLDRQAKLVDSDLGITKLSDELQDDIESWIRQGSRNRELDLRGPDKPPLGTTYVLSCPQMHVVPEFELRTFVMNKRPDLAEMFNKPLLDIDIVQMPCPLCSPPAPVVKNARMIEPLDRVSGKLRYLAEASKVSREAPQGPQMPEVFFSARDPPAGGASSHSSVGLALPLTASSSPAQFKQPEESSPVFAAGSRSTTSGTGASTKRRSSRFSKLFDSGKKSFASSSSEASETTDPVIHSAEATTKRKPDKHNRRHDRYCFSSDGLALILWKSGERFIFACTVPALDGSESGTMWNWSTFVVPGLILGAGGGQSRIAGISRVGTQQRLLVFTAPNNVAILDARLPHVGQVRSIAVSPDGNYVAVGSDERIAIYAVNDRHVQPRQIMLSSTTRQLDSQKINFNLGSNMVAIVTRRINGQMELILQDHLRGEEIWPRKPIDYGQITDNDHGLSAIFYDSEKNRVALFAYINKPYSLVHSHNYQWVHWMTPRQKIQAAIQCPSGSQYRLLTSTGDLYHLDLEMDLEALVPAQMGRKWTFRRQPQSPHEFVALAMPEDDLLYAFRIENNEMILEEIRGNGMPQRILFPAPSFPNQ
ncbi:hypothetical protein N431DRAFT_560502 [Stipitochalara longipes BDJ]|nr:hypothetical protein N431DRAFT_560502 [Stipitochalara longipes BDJ]